METYKYIVILLGANITFLVASWLLLLIVLNKRRKVTDPQILKELESISKTKASSDTIIHRALREAQKILTSAQLKGIGIIATEKLESKKISQRYKNEIAQMEKQLGEQFEKSVQASEQAFQTFMQKSEADVQKHLSENSKSLNIKAASFLEHANQMLSSFTVQLAGEVKQQLTGEFAKARQQIEEYKRQRIQLLEDNIVDVLEDIVASTLSKKLSLSDQNEFIYKALEQALKEGVFGK